ncbi:hypothetical protein BDY17DRAFT_35290 [Neohortaea acidophila]|uniref:Uncharacterized protein n=1 Tax=Neohortaea acidophila TaxID=245834 RepID=A0A6A6PK18_9PEZI|nr:uncharacterized protein BDY17DRAFT_35290 [Neohortaea acidophila]KAF2480275.1 hypothetical protein BDY17DRAFT_35290 [Neohortaea acidophila]
MAPSRYNRSHDYWKIGDYSNEPMARMQRVLAKRNFKAPRAKDREMLEGYMKRSDRGLMSYVGCKNNELRKFIRDRGIEMASDRRKKGLRWELLQALENADKNLRFEKFTSLPPELRNMVYEWYFAGFKEPLDAPVQPPITRTSSLIRTEALPVFYASCIFALSLRKWKRLVETTITHECLLWLVSCNTKYLPRIRRLAVQLQSPNKVHALFSIELRKSFEASDEVTGWAPDQQIGPLMKRKLEQALGDVVAAPGEGGKLNMGHFFALREEVRAGHWYK